ncbi:MAG: protein kinase [Chromatiales bacterium]|nr:protein kinase [Chromatiales bacterium]
MKLKRTTHRRLKLRRGGSWLAGLLLSLTVLGLLQTPLLDHLEEGFYETLLKYVGASERSDQVIVIDSGKRVSQDELSQVVEKLKGARAVALMLPLYDESAALATAIKRADNVWLTSYVTAREGVREEGEQSLSTYLRSQAQPRRRLIEDISLPPAGLLAQARGSGVVLRGERPLGVPAAVWQEEGRHSSLLYQLLPRKQQNLSGDNPAYVYHPMTYLGDGEGIQRYDLREVIADKVSIKSLRGKRVIIGDAVQVTAHAVALDALLNGRQVGFHSLTVWLQYGAWLAVALFLMLLLPRLGLTSGLLSSLLLLFLLLNSEMLFLLLLSQWLPLIAPTLLLLGGYLLITLQRRGSLREARLVEELSTSNTQLGRMLQSQGELEQAWEKYRRCVNSETLREQLYNLGLDFERKRQYNKAVALFGELQRLARNFKDVGERLARNREMGERIVLPQSSAAPGGTVVMEATTGVQRPTLGHYHIEKEIGRGAMGMVYLGQDPRINREVAIKTMALAHEFEGQELKEVKQRFYREAETAGRLNHRNIVTIYDVGEEQELAYIAMDYLKGQDLAAFSSKKSLLPLKEVMAIMEEVAEALDYAHKQKVVHRDIKPANIVYERNEKVVKVTDFGVACLTDASKTKTGTVLGSPSYMSPEQVAGKKVDGRADIFSLGVTLFQLATGHLPFEAESLGSLMFKITNQAHPKPGNFRKGIPICLTRIINKCLQKEPGKRYQSAGEVATALKRCRGG